MDSISGKIADIATTILYFAIFILLAFSSINFYKVIKTPVMRNVNPNLHGIFILLSLFTFFLSMLGDYYKKPSRRIFQYIIIVLSISLFSLNYFAATFNSIIIKFLSNIKNIESVPPDLLIGNIKVVTIFIPAVIVLPMLFLSLGILKDNQSKNELRELEFELLLPTVHKMDDTTIDIELCKDIATGLPCIVPEQILNRHTWLQGGTGSGKTSNYILPLTEQLMYMKAYLTYKLKEKAIYCLENDIAIINRPVSNKWFNENFDLDLIEPLPGKEKQFYAVFDKYILGSLKKEELILEEEFKEKIDFEIKDLKNTDFHYIVKVSGYKNGMIYMEEELKIEKEKENLLLENDNIKIETKKIQNKVHLNLNEDFYDNPDGDFTERTDVKELQYLLCEDTSVIKIEVEGNTQFSYNIKVYIKGNGRMVPKNLGMTLIAPDGELVSNVSDVARDYGIKVYRIDPFMEEIRKGGIAKFNPLKGDSPEKIGDMVASILVSMDVGDSSKVNPYFTNASVRAVRNLVILLKVSYPRLLHRDPTLEDVLNCLNDFSRVKEHVEELENDPLLSKRWGSVIDYFKSSFLDPPKDHLDMKVSSSNIGSQKKETQKAVSGIINQLDNLLGREEIRYILCSTDESIDLNEVLKKGKCVAISTRQGELGARLGKAFALFFILSLQNEVLNRYAENENPEMLHPLIIDEFPMYCNENTETFFSFARKYKCPVTIAIQNMGQLKRVSDEFGETLFTNTGTKLLLPESNLEDRMYWSAFFGNRQEMEITTGVSSNTVHSDNPSYSEQIRGNIKESRNVSENDVDNLKFQQLYYSYTNKKGRKTIGKGTTDFMKKRIEPFMSKSFNFSSYCISEKEYEEKIELEKLLKNEEGKKSEIKKIEEISSNIDNDLFKEVDISNEKPDKVLEFTPNIVNTKEQDAQIDINKLELVIDGPVSNDSVEKEKEILKEYTNESEENLLFKEEKREDEETIEFSLFED